MEKPTPRHLAHHHFRFLAKIKAPPHDEEEGLIFMRNLVKAIGMEMAELSNRQSNPIAWYSTDDSNLGMTLSAILTTSNCTIHIWDKEKELQFDLYSCSCFDPAFVTRMVDMYVGIEEIKWTDFMDRETGALDHYPLGKYNDDWKIT